jgi:hypothetical protein
MYQPSVVYARQLLEWSKYHQHMLTPGVEVEHHAAAVCSCCCSCAYNQQLLLSGALLPKSAHFTKYVVVIVAVALGSLTLCCAGLTGSLLRLMLMVAGW